MFIAYYIRTRVQESPVFEAIKARGARTKNPWKEAFLSVNIKFVAIASVIVLGEGAVWYSSQFWPLVYYLPQVSNLDPTTSAYIVGAGLIIGTPTIIFFGWLSDHIGRKPVILGGFLLAALTYYPLFVSLGLATQPDSINYPVATAIVAVMVSYVGMVYGPIGAFLAEYFPGRIRYTSVSVPYHIGGGFGGGLMPLIAAAVYTATGSLGKALLYSIAVPAAALIFGIFLMPETHRIKLSEEPSARPRI
jgi:MFS family permease